MKKKPIDPDLQPDPEQLAKMTPEVAFRESEELFWKDRKLSPSRRRAQYAAQALGNRLLCGVANIQEVGKVIDPATGEEKPRYNLYDGLFVDVVAMLYLCQCPASEVLMAARKPDAILDKALAWGEAEGISFGSPAFDEAQVLYWRIFEQLSASQFELDSSAKSAPGND
jgi:hypothetical protein